jgi:hypothetical protein
VKQIQKLCVGLAWVWMAAAGFAVTAENAAATTAEAFKAACLPKFSSVGHKPEVSAKLCDCITSETQKASGDAGFARAMKGANIPAEEFLKPPTTICLGRHVDALFELMNTRDCAGKAQCLEGNACVVGELKAKWPELEIGSVLMTLLFKRTSGDAEDKARITQYNQLRNTCTGRQTLKNMPAVCMNGCSASGNAGCAESCKCFASALKAVGTEAEIGELTLNFAKKDAAATEKYKSLFTGCGIKYP